MADSRMDDIRRIEEEGEFEVRHIHEDVDSASSDIDYAKLSEVGDKIKLPFSAFVKLIASRNFDKVLEARKEDEVILSADLLADLALDREEKSTSNVLPIIFVVGLIIGAVITYLLITF